MNTNDLAQKLGDSCYLFLALNCLWGIYCGIVVWRQLRRLRFRNEAAQHEFRTEVRRYLESGDFESVVALCDGDTRALPQLLNLAVNNRDLDLSDLRHLLAETMQRNVLAPIENGINWVITVIRNGPLLGLMGTVLGMMAAFGRIGTGAKVEPAQIADEISVALICTAMGLGTAIPLGYVASSLTIQLRDLQESLGPVLVRFLKVVKPEQD